MFGPHHRQRRHDFFFGRRRWAEGGEPPFEFNFPRDFPFGRNFPFGRGFGRGPGRRWGGPGQGERFFGRGDLKIVILELLKEQPRHGYDIIRALEDRARGMYRPSPGSVYPTLQMLEDLGYVTAAQDEGKKVYSITDAGRAYLAEQQPTVEDLRERLAAGWDAASRPEVGELMHELQALARALFRQASRGSFGDPERLKRLRDIVAHARTEVDALGEQPSSPSSSEPTTII